MSLTKDKENQILDILKNFSTIQAEKRTDMRKLPEIVDVKPIMKELMAEIIELRNDIKDWENDCNQDEQCIKRLIGQLGISRTRLEQAEGILVRIGQYGPAQGVKEIGSACAFCDMGYAGYSQRGDGFHDDACAVKDAQIFLKELGK